MWHLQYPHRISPLNRLCFYQCVHCEAQSYRLHDPMHCFFKIPRPVDRKIQEEEPLLPSLYILAAGEFLEDLPVGSRDDPRGEYLYFLS
jgi:hypothetical protein